MERNENGFPLFPRQGSVTPREGCGDRMPMTPREGYGDNSTPTTPPEGCEMNCSMMNGHRRQLAMVYSPMQCFRMLYNHSDALMRGTLFEELDKPLSEGMR